MTYSADNNPNLPKFDLEVFEIALELGSSEEEAWEVAVKATNDLEPLDIDNL